MNKLIEKLPIYRLFLRIRPRFLSDERLKARLSRRGHNLDKALADDSDHRLYLFELRLLLNEYFRRKLKGTDITRWAWDLVYRAQLNVRETDTVDSQSLDTPTAHRGIREAIKSRRSVRQWDDRAVAREDIIAALDAARWAPSSCNRQVWKFLVVDKSQDKEQLMLFTHQSFLEDAPVVIVALVDTGDYHKEITHYAYLDSGAVIQNLLLSLHAGSLGACWIGVKHDRQFESNVSQFRSYFGLPENLVPVSLIPVGHYSKAPKTPPRKDVEDILIDRMT